METLNVYTCGFLDVPNNCSMSDNFDYLREITKCKMIEYPNYRKKNRRLFQEYAFNINY